MKIEKIAVLGAGTMGSAIAEVMAFNGYNVILRDIEEKFIEKGMNNIKNALDSHVKFNYSVSIKEMDKLKKINVELNETQKEAFNLGYRPAFTEHDRDIVLSRIKQTVDLNEIFDVDLVIEAIPEKIELKKEIFKSIDNIVKEETIIASNTSSLSITELASTVSRPEKVILTHFFNPPYILPLVEVVPALQTSEETEKTVYGFISSLKNHRTSMVPVKIKEVPGFLVNRLLIPMINNAIYMLDENVSGSKEIDTAMKTGAGMPMGPLELADMIGLDIVLDVMEILYREYNNPMYGPAPLLKKMVRAGWLGRKTGRGFFAYNVKK
ncbi:MAG: 3-hydroxyacyl-CoA dehydrogenase NAD-binding domain-containing protein [Candidatus Thermoplasmatota archaeon]|nr:3-hydroxyacyl-CoA dehydrogenase NAD-binding domain-containing protein [Candidatus Thermoplasmatota archaeon]MCL5963297.1 3-hydroxyacyl-CoA dehydrogenase NAD-binding domain-containing protein [Candidatus Thermoplasmatota archaeon]